MDLQHKSISFLFEREISIERSDMEKALLTTDVRGFIKRYCRLFSGKWNPNLKTMLALWEENCPNVKLVKVNTKT